MLFNSYVFVFLFLPVVLAGYALLSRSGRGRAALGWLVAASFVFYGWWNPAYLLLLAPSILANFLLGKWIGAFAGRPRGRTVLVAGLALNLALLGWFKYANFFVDTVNAVTGAGIALGAITLPIGISFFTFQQIAHLVDAYQGRAGDHGLMEYALFVTFFPQLIAGPIVLPHEILPQFLRRTAGLLRSRDLAVGATIFAVGLFKKVVLADTAATFASPVFGAAEKGWTPGFSEAWLGTLAYAMQLYFDFSGYSDMAIGLGRLFGIRLPLNFHSPYKATSVVDFWRRWHMTLSRFLRDHLYVPLGGNRKGPVRRYANLMTTMLLGGLWHGAGWTFVFWGFLHGLYLCANQAWFALRGRFGLRPEGAGPVRRAAACAATFLAVLVAWVFFRAPTFGGAARILGGMAGAGGFTGCIVVHGVRAASWVAVLLAIVWSLPNTQQWTRRWRPSLEYERGSRHWVVSDGEAPALLRWEPTAAWALATALLATAAVVEMAKATEFIYYQF